MNVLSLFDGMSCGRLALDRIGAKVNKYYAAEWDKYASIVTQANWPETVPLGDVTRWREWDIDWSSIDLLLGGSPCQGFSFAGKQAGTKACIDGVETVITSRSEYLYAKEKGALFFSESHLFWEYVLCLDHIRSHNPKVKFLLENVKMKKELLAMISAAMGVEPVFINSALVSAQNRQRYYWTNIKGTGPDGAIAQPEDKNISLVDILELDGMGHIKSHGELIERNDKSMCIDANYHKGIDNHGQRTVVLGAAFNRKVGVVKILNKAYPLNASDWRGLNRNQNQTAVIEILPASIVGRRINPETGRREDNNKDIPLTQCLEVNNKSKARCLSTVSKDTLISLLPAGRYLAYYEFYYRKLTPIECERLQTVPEGYTDYVSNSQRYKMLGNGWTVDVIAHILTGLLYE